MKKKNSIIASLRAKIEEKEQALGAASSAGYHAACSVIIDKYNPVDIRTVTSKHALVSLAGKLIAAKEAYAAGAELLKTSATLTIHGFTVDQWLEDIQTRFTQLTEMEMRAKIEVWKTKLNTLLTEDEWRELEIEKLEKELDA